MTKKVLVTGANGQLAKTIKKLYQKDNEEIDFLFQTKEELDITDNNQVENFFKANRVDYCINCAAYTNVEQAERTPGIAHQINAEGVKNIALACKEFNIVLIHISTDYVFDGEKETPYTEKNKPNPINEYGRSKLLGEQYIQKILDNYFIIRTSWLFSEFGHNFFLTVLNRLRESIAIKVVDTELGSPTDCESLTEFIFELIKNPMDYGIYNFSNDQPMSWFDFANIIENELNTQGSLIQKSSNFKTLAKRPKMSVLCNEKRKKVWEKVIPLELKIKAYISLLHS